MWPFNNNLKQKLKNQDALKKYQEWLKKWLLKGAKFYAISAIGAAVLLIGTFLAIKFILLDPAQPVSDTNKVKPSVIEKVLEKDPPVQQKQQTKQQVKQPAEPAVDLSQLVMPVNGKILMSYNQPYYSETYNDYRFCEGVQFQTKPAEKVKAALPGKITSAELDQYNGFTVIIDHGQGYQTKYAGLDTLQVSVNQQIDKGEILGTTPNKDYPNHQNKLRFTLTHNGQPINPLE